MSGLNPCPSCGCEPQIGEMVNCFIIGCGNCNEPAHCRAVTESGAINAWNAATSEQPAKTLRDEFAMFVLPLAWHSSSDVTPLDDIAAKSYIMADAMLKERNK